MVLQRQAVLVAQGKPATMLNVTTQMQVDVTTLAPSALTGADFPIFGYNAETGETNYTSGWTTAWDEPSQVPQGANAGLWYVPVPTDSTIQPSGWTQLAIDDADMIPVSTTSVDP
ncbi:unnamed protein product [Sphagnum jensenii]